MTYGHYLVILSVCLRIVGCPGIHGVKCRVTVVLATVSEALSLQ